jgi:hypothetical protein
MCFGLSTPLIFYEGPWLHISDSWGFWYTSSWTIGYSEPGRPGNLSEEHSFSFS